MKEKRNCKIVQDLLPTYIENLTSTETNKYVEEHLKQCEECTKIFNNMKKEIELERDLPKRNKKEVKYIKKFNRKLNLLRNILLVILLIVLIWVGCTFRKFLIIKNLQEKAKQIENAGNYKITIHYSDGYTEYYKKDNKIASFSYYYNDENERIETLEYIRDGKVYSYMTTPEEKIATSYSEDYKLYEENNPFNSNIMEEALSMVDIKNDFELFMLCSKIKLEKDNYNGYDCYVLDNSSIVIDYEHRYQTYIDAETGLKRKVSNGHKYVTYEYDFNGVDDMIFEEPDITEYRH